MTWLMMCCIWLRSLRFLNRCRQASADAFDWINFCRLDQFLFMQECSFYQPMCAVSLAKEISWNVLHIPNPIQQLGQCTTWPAGQFIFLFVSWNDCDHVQAKLVMEQPDLHRLTSFPVSADIFTITYKHDYHAQDQLQAFLAEHHLYNPVRQTFLASILSSRFFLPRLCALRTCAIATIETRFMPTGLSITFIICVCMLSLWCATLNLTCCPWHVRCFVFTVSVWSRVSCICTSKWNLVSLYVPLHGSLCSSCIPQMESCIFHMYLYTEPCVLYMHLYVKFVSSLYDLTWNLVS